MVESIGSLNSFELNKIEIACGKIKKNKLKSMPSLRWLQLNTAGLNGYENADLYYDEKRPPILTNARGVFSTPIAEYVVASMIMMSRSALCNNLSTRFYCRNLKIPFENNLELQHSTVIILGCGDIGRKIAKILKRGFSVDMIYGVDISASPIEDFDIIISLKDVSDVLAKADFIINALPHNDDTASFFKLERFAEMKKNSIFINIGRGTTVNQRDLITALNRKMISGAVLDVSVPDPIPKLNILRLTRRLLLTNHASSSSIYNSERYNNLVRNQVERYVKGELLNNIYSIN